MQAYHPVSMPSLSPPVYHPRGDPASANAYASIYYTDLISCPDMNFPQQQQQQPVYYTPPATGAENMFMHGYIGLTFGPHTESFFSSVLKISPRFLQVGFSAPGWPTAFYIAPIENLAVSANAMSSRGNLLMVLDYRADLSRGTIVPQVPWFPQTPRDVRKYVTDASLRLPIFLRQDDGTIGMSLSDVVHGNFRRLTDSVQPVNVGGRTSVHIRMNWPGYTEWKRQFQTRDETPNRNPITFEKFVRHIGRSVDKFMSGVVSEVHQGDPRWRIGYNGITRNDIILVGVVHVSSGSWMPILQLNRRLY